MSTSKPWARRAGLGGGFISLLIAIDQCGNVLIGGDPDTTISTHCGLRLAASDPGWLTHIFCRPVCRMLSLVDPGHCAAAKE